MSRNLSNTEKAIGTWSKAGPEPQCGEDALQQALLTVQRPIYLLNVDGRLAVAQHGRAVLGDGSPSSQPGGYPLLAYAPALHPDIMGDAGFRRAHNVRYAYVAGAMANGITSEKMVEKIGKAGMLAFFGAAGLSLQDIDTSLHYLQQNMAGVPFGSNLIHNPNDPDNEAAVVDLYLQRGVRLISASAFLRLTLPLIRYRVKGIHLAPDGTIVCPNKVIAKVSRIELARKFFAPPPEKLLTKLLEGRQITPQEADLARHIPVAEDLTAEADSGGHTDNRPAIALLPTMLALRDEMMNTFRYPRPLCVGLGGGIATPASTAAAFAMGAGYVLTGTVNQACVEAGISETVRCMLAEAGQADVTMAPAADMFEMGVKVQVLKRGTLFPQRAAKLYDLYARHDAYEKIAANDRKILEEKFFFCSFEEEWDRTRAFFEQRDPKQIDRAAKDPRHKMALVFRSYLGRSSGWAKTGDPARKIDYQIWCGPAIGAFNEWVGGSFLARPENRRVVTVALNLLMGASVVTRTNWLRSQFAGLPAKTGQFSPLPLEEINRLLAAGS